MGISVSETAREGERHRKGHVAEELSRDSFEEHDGEENRHGGQRRSGNGAAYL